MKSDHEMSFPLSDYRLKTGAVIFLAFGIGLFVYLINKADGSLGEQELNRLLAFVLCPIIVLGGLLMATYGGAVVIDRRGGWVDRSQGFYPFSRSRRWRLADVRAVVVRDGPVVGDDEWGYNAVLVGPDLDVWLKDGRDHAEVAAVAKAVAAFIDRPLVDTTAAK